MAHAANFNDDVYDALRDSGMEEQPAMRVAKAVPRVDDVDETKAAIIRIDKTLARLDERSKGDRVVARFIIIPLLLVMLTALFGVIGLLVQLLMGQGQ